MKDVQEMIVRMACIARERDATKKQEMINEIKKDPALNKLFDKVNTLFTRLF